MEENTIIDIGESNKTNNKNLKPFLSVFIIFIILLSGYYFIWRSLTIKMKNIVSESLSNFKYDSITIGGFPFMKKVKVNNIAFSNNVFLITKNQVSVKEIQVSSFIFSRSLEVKFKDITTLNISDNTTYSLIYNEDPEMDVKFYSDGRMESFNYSDTGYRVISADNKTLYTADKSSLVVKSVKNNETIDYAINGEFKNMQNIVVLENKNEISTKVIPEIYNLKFDISSSLTKKDGELKGSVIRINSIDFNSDKNNGATLAGEIIKDQDDAYSYGEIKVSVSNYVTLLSKYKADVITALNIENANLSTEEKKQYVDLTNNLFNMIDGVIKKNPESVNGKGVAKITRVKNASDYIINGESLFGIIQKLVQ